MTDISIRLQPRARRERGRRRASRRGRDPRHRSAGRRQGERGAVRVRGASGGGPAVARQRGPRSDIARQGRARRRRSREFPESCVTGSARGLGRGRCCTCSCAREAVQHRAGQPFATRDLERLGRAFRSECAHPGLYRAANGRRRCGAADLGDLRVTAGDRDQVLAFRRLAVGLDDQLDRALEARRGLEHARREPEDGADIDVLTGRGALHVQS